MNRPVRILHSYTDIYAVTALSGATTYMLVRATGAPAGGCTSRENAADAQLITAWFQPLKLKWGDILVF
jgi:hypothetical protein